MNISRLGALLAGVSIVAFSAVGCATESQLSPEATAALSQQQSVSPVSAEVFAEVIEQPNVVLVDVRGADLYAEGHIPGAINIPAEGGSFVEDIEALPDGVTYAIYCKSGPKTDVAVKIMERIGATPIVTLEGGINAWEAAGLPTTK
jgi:phage shock protein E